MATVRKSPFTPELWGGLECTINRVGDTFRDQLSYSGHYTRKDDIERFASLGITALRYPFLWERHQPEINTRIDWSWAQTQLEEMRRFNITPIAGLVHHGSGPKFTNLEDKNFPDKLAAYANALASRFPELEYFTPVNEPLTTARFSGLYGLWHPHRQDDRSFATMLLHELKGIVLAMEAIRKVNKEAKLVQTEDLSKVHSSPLLRYQADFENERRWLTFDLLCGKVNRFHPLWNYFISLGIQESDLYFFMDHVCAPDIVGLNYYVTSERYLDENIDRFPGLMPGGNGRHTYVDVDACRAGKSIGLAPLLQECWDRYGLPMSITEAHLGCTREEQMRWVKEIWDITCAMNQKQFLIKSVTAWSLLGAYDWDSLLTQVNMKYESGVFDVRAGNVIRKTAVATMISSLATKGEFNHPLLEHKGWWNSKEKEKTTGTGKNQPLLIIGKNGTLGRAFGRICDQRNILWHGLSRLDLDITNEADIQNVINIHKPWAIINATGYVKVDEAETEMEQCYQVNTMGSYLLGKACNAWGLPYMTFSSDLVFNGLKNSPYVETDIVRPINYYGKSKAQAEFSILNHYPGALVIRSSAFFGPWDSGNFAHYILQSLQDGRECFAASDVVVSPTYVPDLVQTALDLLIDEETGIWHIASDGILSWAEFAEEIARHGGYEHNKITTRRQAEMAWKASRPQYSPLQSSRGIKLPTLNLALENYFKERIQSS